MNRREVINDHACQAKEEDTCQGQAQKALNHAGDYTSALSVDKIRDELD
jgi:hypothetical protein